VADEVGLDRVDQVGALWKMPRRIALSVSCPKKISAMVQPAGRGWGEVQVEPRVPLEPGLHGGVTVGG